MRTIKESIDFIPNNENIFFHCKIKSICADRNYRSFSLSLVNLLKEKKLKSLIKSYEDTSDIGFLKEATDIYINNIDETVKNIQILKYTTNLNYDDKDKTYNLIQQPFTLDQLQIPIDKTQNKIISFIK